MQSVDVHTPVTLTWPGGARLIAYPNGAITFIPAGKPDDRRSTTTILLERTLPPLDDDAKEGGKE